MIGIQELMERQEKLVVRLQHTDYSLSKSKEQMEALAAAIAGLKDLCAIVEKSESQQKELF